jgi:hypothetical protein
MRFKSAITVVAKKFASRKEDEAKPNNGHIRTIWQRKGRPGAIILRHSTVALRLYYCPYEKR